MLRKLRNNMIPNIPWEWRAWQPWKRGGPHIFEVWDGRLVVWQRVVIPVKKSSRREREEVVITAPTCTLAGFQVLDFCKKLGSWCELSPQRPEFWPWTLFSYAIAYISLSCHMWEVLSSWELFYYCTAATQFCWICWQIVIIIIALMWSISESLKCLFLVDQNLGTLRILEMYLNFFLWLVSNLSLLISKWKC